MAEEKKKSGLQKDISSIFAGLEDIDNGRQSRPVLSPGSAPRPDGRENPEHLPGARRETPPGALPIRPAFASASAAPLVWGGAFVAGRLLVADLDPITVAWLRFLVASAAFRLLGWLGRDLQIGRAHV